MKQNKNVSWPVTILRTSHQAQWDCLWNWKSPFPVSWYDGTGIKPVWFWGWQHSIDGGSDPHVQWVHYSGHYQSRWPGRTGYPFSRFSPASPDLLDDSQKDMIPDGADEVLDLFQKLLEHRLKNTPTEKRDQQAEVLPMNWICINRICSTAWTNPWRSPDSERTLSWREFSDITNRRPEIIICWWVNLTTSQKSSTRCAIYFPSMAPLLNILLLEKLIWKSTTHCWWNTVHFSSWHWSKLFSESAVQILPQKRLSAYFLNEVSVTAFLYWSYSAPRKLFSLATRTSGSSPWTSAASSRVSACADGQPMQCNSFSHEDRMIFWSICTRSAIIISLEIFCIVSKPPYQLTWMASLYGDSLAKSRGYAIINLSTIS